MQNTKPWPCIDCKIMMILDETGDFCKCPSCKVEVWFKHAVPDADPISELMRLGLRNHKPMEYLPAGEPTPGGGSKSRTKRQKSKKPTLSTLNNKLYES